METSVQAQAPDTPPQALRLAPTPTDAAAPRSMVSALNGAAIIMVGLYFGRELLMPLVLAVLLAFVLAPAATLLQRARLPQTAAVLLTVLLAFGVLGGIGVVVGTQGASLAASLPRYQATIQDKVRSFSVISDVVGRLATSAEHMLSGAGPKEAVVETPAPPATVQSPALVPATAAPSALLVVRTVVEPLLGPLATAGVVLVFLIFVLLSREDLRDRLIRLSGRGDLHRTILAMNDAARRLSQYFLVQLALNAGFGVYVTLALWAAGLPNPLLWGIVAGVMRFVPFIGTALALVPPLLLALAVSPGWFLAILVLAIMLGGDLVMSQVVEPLTYGHSTGLSPLAIIISTAFWAILWGPIGLLIATPLSVCLVVLGRHVESLSFLHVILSDASPLHPDETFYQRALEGKAAELTRQAIAETAKTGRTEYFDHVAIAGLSLAQVDLSRDALDFERLEAIHAHIEHVLAAMAATPNAPFADGRMAPPDWAAPGSILCVPGRGPLDDLAATMAVQSLQARGFGAQSMPNAALGSDVPGAGSVRLCCISVLEGGSSAASIRFFLRRIQRRLPGAAIVVCLWHASADSATLAALRAEGGEEFIVLSIGELNALAMALSARQSMPAETALAM